jgi:Rrf2 family protein
VAVNTQFSIAVHLLAGLGFRRRQGHGDCATSALLAASVNTSPSFVRRTLARLSKAGLVETATGHGGACRLARDPRDISLLEIYRAVDAPSAFAIHAYAAEKQCPVSCNIKTSLEKVLAKTQRSMEATLKDIKLSDVLRDLDRASRLED